MVRNHGWELPLHTFQVIAITVFCLLVVSFYIFFAPFVGSRTSECVLDGAYSTVVLLVFTLYVRSTVINPADPGIMSKLQLSIKPRKLDKHGKGSHTSLSSASKDSVGEKFSRTRSVGEENRSSVQLEEPPHRKSSCLSCGWIFCALFVIKDCCNWDGAAEQQGPGEDTLYCTLCKAEVRAFSKHCRSCDKCVDRYDHHCVWLNNCVGRKNYVTFISLLATSLIWVVLEVGVGFAVFVRCLVDKKSMEAKIVDRLGSGFSRAPFATVVAICIAVSMLGCVHLSQLLLFHMILIIKGITTYEYALAMRAISEAPGERSVDEEMPNILHSTTGSSETGFSNGSSLGLEYTRARCTPPTVFVDNQEKDESHLEPGMAPSTTDPDAAGSKRPKRTVKISAWKLAKLDSNEAIRAAKKARASSSVLKPVNHYFATNQKLNSSENMSITSTEMGITIDVNNKNDLRNYVGPSQASHNEYENDTQTASSFSSLSHVQMVTQSPLPQAQGSSDYTTISSKPGPVQGFNEKKMQRGGRVIQPVVHSATQAQVPSTSFLRNLTRGSIVWDQEAGRYRSVPIRNVNQASRQEKERNTLSFSKETRFKRDSVSNQLPVFIPGDFV